MIELPNIINDLMDSGYPQADIVKMLDERGYKTTRGTLSRIYTGTTPEPRFNLGLALLDLHNELVVSSNDGTESGYKKSELEIITMTKLARAFDALDRDAIIRVLDWAENGYRKSI